jgi:hypothetical protein
MYDESERENCAMCMQLWLGTVQGGDYLVDQVVDGMMY